MGIDCASAADGRGFDLVSLSSVVRFLKTVVHQTNVFYRPNVWMWWRRPDLSGRRKGTSGPRGIREGLSLIGLVSSD